MEFGPALRSSVTITVSTLVRLLSLLAWVLGSRWRMLKRVAGARKDARVWKGKFEREARRRLETERLLAQAVGERDAAVDFWKTESSAYREQAAAITVWAARQATGFGPGDAIPAHLLRPSAPPPQRMTGRELSLRVTNETLHGTTEQ